MSSLITRGSLLDDFFRDVSPSFLIKPLHGDPLPSPEQIKMDVKENDNSFTVSAEIPGVSQGQAERAGCRGVLAIPFDPGQFLRIIKKV